MQTKRKEVFMNTVVRAARIHWLLLLSRLGRRGAAQEAGRMRKQLAAEHLEQARRVVVGAIRAEGDRFYKEVYVSAVSSPAEQALRYRVLDIFALADRLEAFKFQIGSSEGGGA